MFEYSFPLSRKIFSHQASTHPGVTGKGLYEILKVDQTFADKPELTSVKLHLQI